jgi:type IV fimbrial biogenesis protein FimT
MERQHGLTLLEVLVALALLAILAGLATPALDTLRLNASRAAAMDGLMRAAWYARSEAARRGHAVVLCASAGGDACAGSPAGWSGGWLVTPAHDPAAVLRRGVGAGHGRAQLLANRSAFSFEPRDRRSTNGTLAWCDQRGEPAARALVISPTGRPRLERGSGALECATP